MRRTHWLSGWKSTQPSARKRRRHRSHSNQQATESLEIRTLLTHVVPADDSTLNVPDEALPDNVAVTQDPGFFEVAVSVPSQVFDIDWPAPFLIQDVDLEATSDPVLIDLGGLMPLDENASDAEVTDDELSLDIEPLIFPPPEIEFDPDQDILVSVGMFGLPVAEMFGGELPDPERLNDFIENGPSEDGFLSTFLAQFESGDFEDESDSDVMFDLADFFDSGPLVHVELHDDGFEVSASLYQLMLELPYDGPHDLFDDPMGAGFEEDEFSDEEGRFLEGPELEADDEDEDFPGELVVTVEVEDLPLAYAPDWLQNEFFVIRPDIPVLLSDDTLESEIDTEEISESDPPTVSFASSVPVGQLMAEALIAAVFYTLDSNPMFEFTEPDEDFEPDVESFEFNLGLHLVDFGEPDEDGRLPELGINADYEYTITLAELAGKGSELFDDDEQTDDTNTADDPVDEIIDDDPVDETSDDVDAESEDEDINVDEPLDVDTSDDETAAETDDAVDEGISDDDKEPFDAVTITGLEDVDGIDPDILIDPVPLPSPDSVTTIRLSLEFIEHTEEDEPGDVFEPAVPEAAALPTITFDATNVQLNEGVLTIDLPETEDGGWTATASGDDLIIDFESDDREATNTVDLTGAASLVINGTQFDDFVELDLTDIGAQDLDSIAVHGGDGDDALDLIGAAANRFGEVLLTGGLGDDVISVGLTRASVILRGGDGHDLLFGGRGADEIFGGAGDDLLDGGGGHDQLHGGRNNDVILGGGGHDSMWGGAGDDRMVGHAGRDRAFGGSGDDTMMGGRGHDRGIGGSGDDHMDGGAGRDTLRGGTGRDNLMGRSGNDRIFGGADEDTLDGSSGRDVMKGGRGDDLIRGGRGNDRMFGGHGRDRMYGSRGHDRMDGGEDIDSVFGNDGDDTVAGLQDDDIWKGGRGGNLRLPPPGRPPVIMADPPFDPVNGVPELPPAPEFPASPDVRPLPDHEVPDDANDNMGDVDAGFENFDDMVDAL